MDTYVVRSKTFLPYLVVAAALWVRWPIPEPLWSHIDEQILVYTPLGFWSGDLNPHRFNYPSLQFYLNSFLYYCYYLISHRGPLEGFLAVKYFVDSTDLLSVARAAVTITAVATVAVTMRIGQRLYGQRGAATAGLVLCFMPLHVRFSHLANTDIAATFWLSLAILFALRITEREQVKDYIIGGICVGLAGSTKYPAALVGLAVLVAAWRDPLRIQRVLLAGFTALVTFACTNPYTWLDHSAFLAEFSRMGEMHLIGDSPSSPISSWWYFLRYNLRYGLGLSGVIALAIALCCRPGNWRREELVVATSAISFAILLAFADSGFMRYALPLAPLSAVLIARPMSGLHGMRLAACIS
ncbi:MAG: phospholipid carrier-dependent glycosyltransferase, partial [Gemmatimonadetes bacterium]|nr:phospholipid carrier-dependent glycosyltransferase [Gemmatimonadota bacterium]